MQETSGTKMVDSMKQVDMSNLALPVIAIYRHPEDIPDKYVARVFDLDKPTNVIMVKDTLEEIQEDIRENTAKVFMPRGAEDVMALVGVWM